MKVKELKKMLDRYPDDMEVLMDLYSDYHLIQESEWSVVKGVDKGGYVMRPHRTMSADNEEKEYLHLEGN